LDRILSLLEARCVPSLAQEKPGMFQPEPTAYLQVQAGGYGGGMAHGLPEYTFEETPLGLGGGRGGYGGGPGSSAGAGGGGNGGAGSLIYTTPIFSASSSNSAIGPAPGSAYHGPFHHSSTTTTASTSPSSSQLQQHHRHPNNTHLHSSVALKMETNDDLAAQEAAARDYQPNLKGPAVGNKTPSSAITEEYAKADPIYVQKTLRLDSPTSRL